MKLSSAVILASLASASAFFVAPAAKTSTPLRMSAEVIEPEEIAAPLEPEPVLPAMSQNLCLS